MVYLATIQWTFDESKSINDTLADGPTDIRILPKIKKHNVTYVIKTSDDESKNLISHLADLNLDEIKTLTAPIYRYGLNITNDVLGWKLLKVQDISKDSDAVINPVGGPDIYQVKCKREDLQPNGKTKSYFTHVYVEAANIIEAINYMTNVYPVNSFNVQNARKTTFQGLIHLE